MTTLSQHAAADKLAELFEISDRDNESFPPPVEVDFLNLFPDKSGRERATHLLHPYPAKLIRNIPRFFLACEDVSPPGSIVLDPFCGSGTVLLEAQLSGLNAVGADANPLARLIAIAKLDPPTADYAKKQLERVMKRASSAREDLPDVVNIDYWFSPHVKGQLARLRSALKEICGDPWADPFLWVCFSACVRRVSLADPRLSVPVRINPERAKMYGAKGDQVLQRFERLKSVEVLQVFWQVALANIRRLERTVFPTNFAAPVLYEDARSLGLEDASIDLVITSPPYVGAQKYVRASSLCLGWLGFSPGGKLRPIERQSIGREHLNADENAGDIHTGHADVDELLDRICTKNTLRARIASTYIKEMDSALAEIHRVLRIGGKMILVVGPNMVSGYEFDTPGYLSKIASSKGMRLDLHLVDTIASRGLMTKRNKTAGTIAQESVFVLTKINDD
ncbi:MAG: DNA methyltransferase [Hyphomonas sp.]